MHRKAIFMPGLKLLLQPGQIFLKCSKVQRLFGLKTAMRTHGGSDLAQMPDCFKTSLVAGYCSFLTDHVDEAV
ncbi:hypothetical protein D9M68_899560 [compost metagenome]